MFSIIFDRYADGPERFEFKQVEVGDEQLKAAEFRSVLLVPREEIEVYRSRENHGGVSQVQCHIRPDCSPSGTNFKEDQYLLLPNRLVRVDENNDTHELIIKNARIDRCNFKDEDGCKFHGFVLMAKG